MDVSHAVFWKGDLPLPPFLFFPPWLSKFALGGTQSNGRVITFSHMFFSVVEPLPALIFPCSPVVIPAPPNIFSVSSGEQTLGPHACFVSVPPLSFLPLPWKRLFSGDGNSLNPIKYPEDVKLNKPVDVNNRRRGSGRKERLHANPDDLVKHR